MTELAEGRVISLADRLRQRREELGLSQAQAARELDVARTAYRLWEMEAAKPQPDRWRLISRWLGVSVTTMLLADELDDETSAGRASEAFDRVGLAWDDAISAPSEFFARAHDLIQEGVEKGFLTTDHAQDLLSAFHRIEDEQAGTDSEAWEPARLYRQLRAGARAPRESREAIAFVLSDLPAMNHSTAQLLVSELVTNSVKHGQQRNARIGLLIDVSRERLRVEVSDIAAGAPEIAAPTDTGGYGLTLVDQLASRWDTERAERGNLTWFELDLPLPGAKPQRL